METSQVLRSDRISFCQHNLRHNYFVMLALSSITQLKGISLDNKRRRCTTKLISVKLRNFNRMMSHATDAISPVIRATQVEDQLPLTCSIRVRL